MTDGPTPYATSPSRLWRHGVVCAVLATQVLVPGVVQLFDAQPNAQFSWQMFSVVVDRPKIEVVDTDGTISSLKSADLHINRRDIVIDAEVLARVCEIRPDTAEFRILEGNSVTTHECSG